MAITRHHSSMSPIMNGLSTPRSESPAVMMTVDSPGRQPPASPRVNSCKNCKFSFRSNIEGAVFCSKDCETCFTIFKSSMPPQQPLNQAAIQEVKNEIYMFKKQLEMMDEPLPPPVSGSPSLNRSSSPAVRSSSPAIPINHRDSPVSMGIAHSDVIDSPKTAHKKASSRFNFNMALFRPSPEFAAAKKNVATS